jgi:hypothetical protein
MFMAMASGSTESLERLGDSPETMFPQVTTLAAIAELEGLLKIPWRDDPRPSR